MMSCTRLYVDPTATQMGQARKKRLLGLLKQWRENMRRHNSFLIRITPKDNTQAFKHAENKHSKSQETGHEGHFSALYVIIEVPPCPPWTCPLPPSPPYLQPIPPPSTVQPLHPPRWYLFHDDYNNCHAPPSLLRVCRKGGQ